MMFDDEEWLRDNGLWDIADPTELYDKIVERRERGDDGIPAPISKLHGLFTLPLRAVSILGAYSGTGKSTFACQWALSAAASGRNVAIMSLEMPADFTLELLAEQSACIASPHLEYVQSFSHWANGKIYLHNSTSVISPDAVLTFVRVAKTMLGCDMIVIDPLMMTGMANEVEAERDFITRLSSMARDYEVAILLVHHLRKPPSGGLGEKTRPDKSSFLGSTHLTGAAGAVITLFACPDKREARSNGDPPDDDSGADYYVSILKSRFSAWHGSVGLYQHNEARLLCNSRARMYKPVNLKEDAWSSTESVKEDTPSGSLMKVTPENMPEFGTTSRMTGSRSALS
jgi:replicative DNA helicase